MQVLNDITATTAASQENPDEGTKSTTMEALTVWVKTENDDVNIKPEPLEPYSLYPVSSFSHIIFHDYYPASTAAVAAPKKF